MKGIKRLVSVFLLLICLFSTVAFSGCEHMSKTLGDEVHVAFEQLKVKLQTEGLFDPAEKKPLPQFPARIAIIAMTTRSSISVNRRFIFSFSSL